MKEDDSAEPLEISLGRLGYAELGEPFINALVAGTRASLVYVTIYLGKFMTVEAAISQGTKTALALVARLLFGGSPSNIALRVVTIVVYSINRMFWRWTRADFRKELFERFEARTNAATAVMFP